MRSRATVYNNSVVAPPDMHRALKPHTVAARSRNAHRAPPHTASRSQDRASLRVSPLTGCDLRAARCCLNGATDPSIQASRHSGTQALTDPHAYSNGATRNGLLGRLESFDESFDESFEWTY